MKEKLAALGSFIQDHIMLVLVGAGAIALFFFLAHHVHGFEEFAYGLTRFVIVVLAASAVIYLVFKDTIRPYLSGGGFVADFNALEAKHKAFITVAIIIAVIWASVEVFVHP